MTRIISERAARINALTGRTETTLLYLKYVDDVRAEEADINGVVTGISLRVLARTLPDGRTSVAASLYRRVHRTRASGKTFHYWNPIKMLSMSRTKQGLIVMRDLNNGNGKMDSSHQWAESNRLDFWIQRLGDELRHTVRAMRNPRVLEGPAVDESHQADLPDDQLSGETTMPYLEAMGRMVDAASAAAREHLGALPSVAERLPLLAHHTNPAHKSGGRNRPFGIEQLSGAGYMSYLDATDMSQVAKNIFGIKRYRRPLVAEIQRLDTRTISWFTQFRGLVPIEWIIDAMRETQPRRGRTVNAPPTSLQWRQIRAILRRTPEPVLGRILKEPVSQAERTLVDAANASRHQHAQLRNLDLLPELIHARGQRRVRNSRDLEHLVRSLPENEQSSHPRRRAVENVLANESYAYQEMVRFNREVPHLPAELHVQEATWEQWKDDAFRQRSLALLEEHRRAIMNERQRAAEERREQDRLARIARQADRAAWAERTAHVLDGLEVATGMVVEVAKDAQTLARWGAVMNNCIGGYSSEIGLDVLAAVVERSSGAVRLNLQIEVDAGVVQFLGKNNRDATSALPKQEAQQIVDAIVDAGVSFADDALGMRGLRARELQAA
jgi:hypothetical protein